MKIVAFLCNWCSYEASTAAGSKRLSCPSDVVFIRVLCTGMINPQTVLSAFAGGADGVMILGCHPGDCHYREGNLHALKRVTLLKRLLSNWGVDRRRLKLDWVSASQSDRFVRLVNSFHEEISELDTVPGGKSRQMSESGA